MTWLHTVFITVGVALGAAVCSAVGLQPSWLGEVVTCGLLAACCTWFNRRAAA